MIIKLVHNAFFLYRIINYPGKDLTIFEVILDFVYKMHWEPKITKLIFVGFNKFFEIVEGFLFCVSFNSYVVGVREALPVSFLGLINHQYRRKINGFSGFSYWSKR